MKTSALRSLVGLVGAVALVVGNLGCSSLFVDKIGDFPDRNQAARRCTSSYLVPGLDLAALAYLTIPSVDGIADDCASENGGCGVSSALFTLPLAAGIAFGYSALVGFEDVSACRDLARDINEDNVPGASPHRTSSRWDRRWPEQRPIR